MRGAILRLEVEPNQWDARKHKKQINKLRNLKVVRPLNSCWVFAVVRSCDPDSIDAAKWNIKGILKSPNVEDHVNGKDNQVVN